MSNPNFDAILATTLKNYVPKLVDNVFTTRVLVFFLKQAGNIRQIGGGAKIVLPLIHGQNTTVGSYSGYDTIAITAQTGISAAEYDWKQYAASVAINGLEEAQNSSEEQVIDLLEGKIMQTEESISEGMNTMFHADGTGNGGKDWNGLTNLVAATGTIGGIDSGAQAYWRSYVESTAAALTIGQMATAYNTVAVGNDQPSLVLTTQTLYEKYEALLQPALRYTDPGTADAGFQNLLFKGAKVCYDGGTPSGRVYFLNPKYLRLVGHTDVWFKPTPFVRPTNQDARYAQILCYGNLTVSNRARQGVLTAKTA